MCVHVRDVAGGQAGVRECELDGARGAAALRFGLGDVVPVGRHAHTGVDAVDACTAGLRVCLGLENEGGCALAHDEAVAALVIGAGGAGRVVVARRECAHDGERGNGHRMQRGFGAADDDDIGATVLDHAGADGNRFGAGGAGGDGAVHTGLRAELEADPGGRAVGHELRDGEHRNPVPAAFTQGVVVAEHGDDAADAGGVGDAQTGLVHVIAEAGVGPGLA